MLRISLVHSILPYFFVHSHVVAIQAPMMPTMRPSVPTGEFAIEHLVCVSVKIRDSKVRHVNVSPAQVRAMGEDAAKI